MNNSSPRTDMQSTPSLQESLLRPSENLQCLLDVDLAAGKTPSEPPHRTDPTLTPFRRHLIAVVTHRNHSQEEVARWVSQSRPSMRSYAYHRSSLFVLIASPTNVGVSVIDALPITEHLALAVAQVGPLDSQTTESSPSVSGKFLPLRLLQSNLFVA